ncbi:MAG: hypothetical protein KME45_27030 [Stenomitos rutilans HA7619-LM2]|jgi:hypothetical protein|nr:hypothetical protein [Stenomitos rutilans HA7619-LM2]
MKEIKNANGNLLLAFKVAYPNGDNLLESLNFLQAQQAQQLPLAAAANLSDNQKLKDLVSKK